MLNKKISYAWATSLISCLDKWFILYIIRSPHQRVWNYHNFIFIVLGFNNEGSLCMVTLQGKTILLMNMKLWNFALDILKYFVKLVNLDSSICLTCVMYNCDFVHCAKWMIFIFMHKSLELR